MKQVPFSLETEKQIIVTLVNNPALILDFMDELFAADFYDRNSKIAYTVLVDMYKSNRAINLSSVYEEAHKLDKEFDPLFIADFYCGDTVTLNQHVDYLKQLAIRRNLILKTEKLLEQLHSQKPHEDMLEEVDKSLFDITIHQKGLQHISDLTYNAFHVIDSRLNGSGLVKTGFAELDRCCGGFLPGQLIIIGARTSIGKTSFIVSLAHNVMNLGKRVLFFSLEMPSHEIVLKLLSIESDVDFRDLLNGAHRTSEYNQIINDAASRLENFPMYLEDSVNALTDIKVVARRAKKEKDIQLICIDYLGLIETNRYRDSKTNEVGYITRELKILAKELSVPIVVLCQLNRETEKGGDAMPKLMHLRDSGSIEQDADMVLFLYREHYYNPEADPHDALLIIAKQRLGPTGRLNLYYQPGTMQFRDER